jgi:hybrid cluster-associated redox disulfide protein
MNDMDHIAELTITEVLERWPATAAVFGEFNMACVGCAVADYYTVADAAQVYDVPVEEFMNRLKAAVLVASAE